MNLNAAFETFSAAQVAGQQINADLQAKKDVHEARQQELAQSKAQMAMAAQAQQREQEFEQQRRGIVAKFDQTASALKTADGQAPDQQAQQAAEQEAKMYTDIGKAGLLTNPALAQQYFKLADMATGRSMDIRKKNLEIAEKKTKDTASFAGAVLAGGVPQEQQFEWIKNNIGMEEALKLPTDPAQAKLYWKSLQRQGLTANEQVVNEEKVREFEVNSKQKAKEAADTAEDRRIRRAELAASREANMDMRKERLALSKEGMALRTKQFEEGGTVQHQRNIAAVEYGAEIARNLGNVTAFASGTNGALFQGVPAGTSILGALQGNTTNKLTPEGEQMLKVAFEGVGLEMGQLMTSSGGRGVNQTLSNHLQEMIAYRASDTPTTKLFKIANAAELARVRLEATPEPSNPEVKAKREQAIAALRSYPNPEDIIAVATRKGQTIPGAKTMTTTRDELKRFIRNPDPAATADPSGHPADVADLLNKYK